MLHGLSRSFARPSSSLKQHHDDERPINRSKELSVLIVAIFGFVVNFLIVNGAVAYRDETTMPPPPSPFPPPSPPLPPPPPGPSVPPPSL